jgi:hypothetical protein
MKYLILLVASLQIADAMLTRSAVATGLVDEWNPLVAPVAAGWEFVILKCAGALLSALALWTVYRRFPGMALVGANCVILFYTAVLAWNLNTLLRI